MKQIKQTLSEELNKMKYMLGYQRGMVISEQDKEQPKLSIRQLVEKDIATENLGLTWGQVKQSFGSTGQAAENQNLYKAWKGGWRPGKPVPDQFQTPTYKQNNQNAAGTTTTTTIAQDNQNLGGAVITTPEDAQKAIEQAEQKAKELKAQVKMDAETCRVVGRAINPIMPLKKGVTSPELCTKLWQCIEQGYIRRGEQSFTEACPKPVTDTTTTVSPAVTTTTTLPILSNKTAG